MQHNSRIVNKEIESVWVDEIEGRPLTNSNADEIANMVKGSVILNGKPFVTIPTPRGELLVREGDFVGKDQRGNWHIVRLRDTYKDGSSKSNAKSKEKNSKQKEKNSKNQASETMTSIEQIGKETLSAGEKFLRSVSR